MNYKRLREALHLPGSLAAGYIWPLRAEETLDPADVAVSGGGSLRVAPPVMSWGAAVMAGLPNLMIAILEASTTLQIIMRQTSPSWLFMGLALAWPAASVWFLCQDR